MNQASLALGACLTIGILLSGCLGVFSPWEPTCHLMDTGSLGLNTAPEPGPDEVGLLVTRDHGRTILRGQTLPLQGGETVMDVLKRAADVEATHGGRFVVAIDGLRSQSAQGSFDWFYEVDGRFAQVGAADLMVQGGERIHWDYREWDQVPVPGLFNTFPWTAARVLLDDAVDPGALPGNLSNRTEPWTGQWPEDPAVLLTTPENAPWDRLPWFLPEGPAVNASVIACDERIEPPWAIASRAGPLGSVQAVLVTNGQPFVQPGHAAAWIATGEQAIEVSL